MITGLVDPMAYMIALGLAGSAFIILVFATWTPTASISTARLSRWPLSGRKHRNGS